MPIDRSRARREVGATFRLALPMIAAQLSAIGTNVVDAVLAGHQGAHTQASVVTGANIWALAIVTGIGTMMAVPPTVAQLDGAGRRSEIGATFHQALYIAWGLGILLGFGVWHASPLMAVFGVVESMRADVQAFLHAIAFAAPALTTYFALRGLSEGLSMPRPSMYFSFGGLVILAPLGYVLMYGKLGFPVMGARGSGIATAIVLWLEMIGFGIYVLKHRNYRDLNLRQRMARPDRKQITQLLHVGVPMAVTLLMEAGLFVAVALLIGRLGETVTASHHVALNVASVAFMIPLGLSMAITVRVGNAVGRRDALAVRYAGLSGISLVLVTQCLSSGAMLLFAVPIASLYTNDPAVIAMASQLLILAGFFQFSDGIQVASNGALRGLKDTRVPMVITLFAYWFVGMPIGWWLAFQHNLGARGMWMGLIAGLSMAAILLFARFWRSSGRPHWPENPDPAPMPFHT
ncbi:MATE family efflux transporter [Luteibacter anthropi]|uniref:Multidrug-efflux transporter n=1 Tax=Luteibacter anthropi TaxID=564369 RepID=A0A7X5UCZ0_9GAMM|nr:MATE family efflux transporter [Luteibacter anthropi]NII08188.1 MATE family efflux transporter [Luteibacter anthropi]URX64152.1 MATE family efflux transporter [Luteibacter anthropi]